MIPLEETAIDERVLNALETMCFVLADAVNLFDDALLCRHARITYELEGESAVLELSASDGFVAEVASGLLGIEPDEFDLETDARYVVQELANVFCGEVLELVGGADTPSVMGIPETVDGDLEAGDAIVRAFDSMGEPLRIRLTRSPR